MTDPRYGPGCVALDGKLYAVGSNGATEQLDTAEVYDPQTDGWQPLAKMGTARGVGLAAVGGKIYAIGGYAGGSTLTRSRPTTRSSALGLWWRA